VVEVTRKRSVGTLEVVVMREGECDSVLSSGRGEL